MTKRELEDLLQLAQNACRLAGEEIMDIYNSEDFEVQLKEDDSPLTKADNEAHRIIVEMLSPTGIPILSEEGVQTPFEERRHWRFLWIVDPLDGTREFIKRNGEFTVNIALVESGKPIIGAIYAPVLDKLYYGGRGVNGYMEHKGKRQKLSDTRKVDKSKAELRVVASRSHLNDETKKFLAELAHPSVVNMGSSLKFMMLAEGKADIYPRFAPTCEWDTAAAHAILLGLGGDILDKQGKSLAYNKLKLLNPYFCAR